MGLHPLACALCDGYLISAGEDGIVLAWSFAEAGRYLETLKAYARKPADLIKERTDGSFVSQHGDDVVSDILV